MMTKHGKKKCTAIVLAAGQGRRMGSAVQKQYIELEGKPLIYYTLQTFEKSEVIDDVILVVGPGQIAYVQEEILDPYHIEKVHTIVEGGKERYESVFRGLQAVKDSECYVFIHDGARMFVDEAILQRGYEYVEKYGACVAGMPSKDTVKMVDEENFAVSTPDRRFVWTVQTPQVFEYSLIEEAYSKLMKEEEIQVTDDAMVAEQMLGVAVRLFEGSYRNLKITTPEDLEIAGTFLQNASAS